MKKLSLLYVVLAGVLWGTSTIFFNLLSPFGFSPLQMTAMRGCVSAIVMVIYALVFNRDLFKVSKKELILFALSGFSVFGTASCYYASMDASSASTAVVLMYTAPVFVMIYSVFFLSEKFTKTKALSVSLMIVGCALVSGIIGGARFNFLGILLGFASGISYSAYNIFTKIQMIHKSNSTSATLYCFVFLAIISAVFSSPQNLVQITIQNPYVIVPLIIGIGVFTCVLPYFFYTMALKYLPAGEAASLGIIEPMAATVFSIVFFDEKLSVASFCGIVLILTAVFILSKSGDKLEG